MLLRNFHSRHGVFIGLNNLCLSGNGGCNQVCHPDEHGHVMCSCFQGHILDTDNRTCIGTCSDHVKGKVSKRIAQLSRLRHVTSSHKGQPHRAACKIGAFASWRRVCCAQTERVFVAAPRMKCDTGEFACRSGECINLELSCDGIQHCLDSSDEEQYMCSEFASNHTARIWRKTQPHRVKHTN